MEADLQEYESDNELISINGFLIRGNGRVDDISTSSQVYENAEQTKETQIIYYQNALNQRVAKEVNNEIVEKYLWANLTTLLATYDKDNNLIQRFNYTNNRMPTSMTQNNETYYLHYDQVGTLRAVSNQENQIVKEITYDTYGNILSDTNKDFTIPFGFAGGLHDRDTNLVHFGYREYDPLTGKWTAKDPIDFNGGDSNLYGYVLQNPVGFIDPEGLQPNDKWYGYNDKDFKNWFHRCWEDPSAPDADKAGIKEAYEEWLRHGSPKGGKCVTPPDIDFCVTPSASSSLGSLLRGLVGLGALGVGILAP